MPMDNQLRYQLIQHAGHMLVSRTYTEPATGKFLDVTLECEDCGIMLATSGASESDVLVQATYVSIWDDSTRIGSSCLWNTEARRATGVEIITEWPDLGSCTREYVQLADGTQIDVDSEYQDDNGIPAIDIIEEAAEEDCLPS